MGVSTKTGDDGTTSLLSGERVGKDDLRVEAYGSVDEINSALGLARSHVLHAQVSKEIFNIQKNLMLLMAELATSGNSVSYIKEEHCEYFENIMHEIELELPPVKQFLIPGDSLGAAALDLARTVTRRAERQVLRLSRQEAVSKEVMIFLNRLSDFCFVLMRLELSKL